MSDASDPQEPEVGGLEEVLPEPLMPLWERWDRFQQFRDTYGDTYTSAMEAILGVILIGGYLFWLFNLLTA